jgi:hypothetical protein
LGWTTEKWKCHWLKWGWWQELLVYGELLSWVLGTLGLWCLTGLQVEALAVRHTGQELEEVQSAHGCYCKSWEWVRSCGGKHRLQREEVWGLSHGSLKICKCKRESLITAVQWTS